MEFDYLEERYKNILPKFRSAILAGDVIVGDDDKIHIQVVNEVNTPWIHAKLAPNRECPLYHAIFFKMFNIIHPVCMECWKVVARPQTLLELVEIHDWQKRTGYPSKCGLEESRKYVSGNYGAYWYTDAKEEGLDRLDEVREAFPGVPVILKRACTEFEQAKGASHRWEMTPIEEQTFNLLDELLVLDLKYGDDKLNPEWIERDVKLRWVEFAYSIGDDTYKDFTGGLPLFAPPVTYEREGR